MYTKQEISNLLEVNDLFVKRSILKMYERQTLEEKISKDTIEPNGIGFSAVDAYYLSSIAIKLKRNKRLTNGEFLKAKNKIKKYSGQITDIANNILVERLKKLNYFKIYLSEIINDFQNKKINHINDYVNLIEEIKSLCEIKEN